MKWYKHDSTASDDPKIKKLMYKHGLKGYGLYFYTLELIARDLEKDFTGKLSPDWDEDFIATSLGETTDNVRIMYDTMIQLKLFTKKDGVIYNHKIIERCDDYTAKVMRKQIKQAQSTDNVRTKSENVPLEQTKTEQKRTDKTTTDELLLKFLKKRDDVKSPEGYLKWLKDKYGVLPKRLLETEFSKWISILEEK